MFREEEQTIEEYLEDSSYALSRGNIEEWEYYRRMDALLEYSVHYLNSNFLGSILKMPLRGTDCPEVAKENLETIIPHGLQLSYDYYDRLHKTASCAVFYKGYCDGDFGPNRDAKASEQLLEALNSTPHISVAYNREEKPINEFHAECNRGFLIETIDESGYHKRMQSVFEHCLSLLNKIFIGDVLKTLPASSDSPESAKENLKIIIPIWKDIAHTLDAETAEHTISCILYYRRGCNARFLEEPSVSDHIPMREEIERLMRARQVKELMPRTDSFSSSVSEDYSSSSLSSSSSSSSSSLSSAYSSEHRDSPEPSNKKKMTIDLAIRWINGAYKDIGRSRRANTSSSHAEAALTAEDVAGFVHYYAGQGQREQAGSLSKAREVYVAHYDKLKEQRRRVQTPVSHPVEPRNHIGQPGKKKMTIDLAIRWINGAYKDIGRSRRANTSSSHSEAVLTAEDVAGFVQYYAGQGQREQAGSLSKAREVYVAHYDKRKEKRRLVQTPVSHPVEPRTHTGQPGKKKMTIDLAIRWINGAYKDIGHSRRANTSSSHAEAALTAEDVGGFVHYYAGQDQHEQARSLSKAREVYVAHYNKQKVQKGWMGPPALQNVSTTAQRRPWWKFC